MGTNGSFLNFSQAFSSKDNGRVMTGGASSWYVTSMAVDDDMVLSKDGWTPRPSSQRDRKTDDVVDGVLMDPPMVPAVGCCRRM
jgi:hypothetical protein